MIREPNPTFFFQKTVLITGGTGFVGSHFCENLLNLGAKVRIPIHQRSSRLNSPDLEQIPADLMRTDDCRNLCTNVDFIVHAAGPVSGVGLKKEPYSYLENMRQNTLLLFNMLQAAWHQGVRKFLLFSSSTGYPAIEQPVNETDFWMGDVPESYLGYGWMRRYFEKLGEFVGKSSGMQVLIVRPTAIYGAWDNFDPLTSHVIAALIKRAFDRETPFEIWGTGQEVRDFLEVRDLVRGGLLMLEHAQPGDPVNIGSGQAYTIAEIARLILNHSGNASVPLIFNPERPSALPYRAVNIQKAQNSIGFYPQISLEEGISDLCSWYAKTYSVKL